MRETKHECGKNSKPDRRRVRHQENELSDQLFRLKFQLKMGQNESLKKIRGLRKDIARVKTIQREKQLARSQAPKRRRSSHGRRDENRRQTEPAQPQEPDRPGVSTKMAKTIVVEVKRQKAHPLYRRVVARTKKFYAHDEEAAAHVGDFVRIEETRPLSKLKRWQLKEIVRRAALVGREQRNGQLPAETEAS